MNQRKFTTNKTTVYLNETIVSIKSNINQKKEKRIKINNENNSYKNQLEFKTNTLKYLNDTCVSIKMDNNHTKKIAKSNNDNNSNNNQRQFTINTSNLYLNVTSVSVKSNKYLKGKSSQKLIYIIIHILICDILRVIHPLHI